jgi:diguanylate cyclase (GGDEF)-like protein
MPEPDGRIERALRLHRAGRSEDALPVLQEALEAGRNGREPQAVIAALHAIGTVHYELDDFAGALDHYLQALALEESAGTHASAHAHTLRTIGIIYSRSGDAEQGLALYRQSLALARSAGDDEAAARTLNNIGINCKNLGRLKEAKAALEEAHAIFEARGDRARQGGALTNLGLVLARMGDPAGAESCHRRALALTRESDFRAGLLNALRDLGTMLVADGRLGEAQPLLEEALEVAVAMNSQPERAACHRALAQLHKRAGRYEEALADYEAFHELERTVFNDESDRKLRQLQVRFNVGQLERQALEDGLTGLANRREFDQRLAAAIDSAGRSRSQRPPLALALADVDNFKSVNDRLSHAVGDEVLRGIARVLRAQARASDLPARYGGEEFALILPATPAAEAQTSCDRVRVAVQEHGWHLVHPELKVTLSIGVALLREGEPATSLLARADKQLYAAKHAGKNRVHVEA